MIWLRKLEEYEAVVLVNPTWRSPKDQLTSSNKLTQVTKAPWTTPVAVRTGKKMEDIWVTASHWASSILAPTTSCSVPCSAPLCQALTFSRLSLIPKALTITEALTCEKLPWALMLEKHHRLLAIRLPVDLSEAHIC